MKIISGKSAWETIFSISNSIKIRTISLSITANKAQEAGFVRASFLTRALRIKRRVEGNRPRSTRLVHREIRRIQCYCFRLPMPNPVPHAPTKKRIGTVPGTTLCGVTTMTVAPRT